jgi:alkaline phosphatase D
LGFGSCITEKRDQPIWKAIEKENINEFFFMGDNVYGDTKDGLLDGMRASYDKQKKMFPEWLSNKKLNAIWDDHDYGKNDGGTEYTLKDEAQRLFLEFWNIDANDPRHKRKGIYFNEEKIISGLRVNLIGLDTRYHRSPLDQQSKPYYPSTDTTKTMLGDEQWAWLEKVLNNKNDLNIIVSSIQVLPTDHIFEKWHNLPHERKRLIDLLNAQSKPTIILSGDRHKAAIYKKGNLIEMTSSSMNKPVSKPLSFFSNLIFSESDKYLISDIYESENYGLIIFNDDKNVEIILKDLDGVTISKYKVM